MISGILALALGGGASVAFAAITFNQQGISSDGGVNVTLGGASVWDVGAGALSLQTANNGPITTGSGLFTAGGGLTVTGAFAPLQGIGLSYLAAGAPGSVILANGSGVPAYAQVSGEGSLSSSGAFSLATTTVGAGTYTNPTFTVDAKGRLTAASSGPASTGISSLNGLSGATQAFATSSAGADFDIVSSGSTHTFRLPSATSTARGLLTGSDWTVFNAKEPAIAAGTSAQYFRGDKTFQALTTAAVTEGANLYYTDARARGAFSAAGPIALDAGTGVISFSLATTTGNLPVAAPGGWTTLAAGTNGKVLTASSTAVGGVSWEGLPGAMAAIASLNGSASSTQTFATGTDANIQLNIGTAGGVHTFAPGWTGILAVGRGGTGTNTAFTSGSLVFAGGSGAYAQDNAKLFWDDSAFRLGIGTNGPSQALDVVGNAAVSGTLTVGGTNVPGVLAATSGSIGGSLLGAGSCASGATTVTGATTTMAVVATPRTYPGDGIFWHGYVSATDTVTVKVCAAVLATPTASTYVIRVIR